MDRVWIAAQINGSILIKRAIAFAKIWVRKRLIFISTLLGAGLAFGTAKLITPTYIGAAQIAIKSQQASVPIGDRNIPVMTPVLPEVVQTEAFALQSRTLAIATIADLHLDRDPEFNPSLRKPSWYLGLLDDFQGWVQPLVRSLSWITDPEAGNDEPGEAAGTDKSAESGHPSTAVVLGFMSRLSVTVQQKSNVIGSFIQVLPARNGCFSSEYAY